MGGSSAGWTADQQADADASWCAGRSQLSQAFKLTRPFYYHWRDLEYIFFQTDFHKFVAKFQHFFHISLKYSNLGITPIKITEILRNSEKIGEQSTKNCKICRLLEKPIASNFAKWCTRLEKSQKSGMVQKKNVDLVKSFQTSIYLQHLAWIQPRTSLRKIPKNLCSKGPRW